MATSIHIYIKGSRLMFKVSREERNKLYRTYKESAFPYFLLTARS